MYRRTQVGTWLLLPMSFVGIALVVAALAAGPAVPFLVGVAIVAGIAWQFTALTVSVDGGDLRVAFGPGWIRRTIPIGEVVHARRVHNRWWYGWGIRLTPHGWLWNVQGLDAVEVRFRDGRSFRIGTDDPDGLCRAIEHAIAARHG